MATETRGAAVLGAGCRTTQDGGLCLFDDSGSAVWYLVTPNVGRLLLALTDPDRTRPLWGHEVWAILFDHQLAPPRPYARLGPFWYSASERASMSRTLRRLRAKGLVERDEHGDLRPTEALRDLRPALEEAFGGR